VLHEKKGGYANNIRAVRGLAAKAEAEGVQIAAGVRVTGFGISGNAVTSVETDQGAVACDQLVIAAGPWIRDLWAWLDLPDTITAAEPGGTGETRPADVDLLGAAGGHAGDRAGRVHRQPRRLPARHPRGLRRAAV
jgi:glycine/D-amino acid oxidase-like deaminating enzyme